MQPSFYKGNDGSYNGNDAAVRTPIDNETAKGRGRGTPIDSETAEGSGRGTP
jgi:hypothetical protein